MMKGVHMQNLLAAVDLLIKARKDGRVSVIHEAEDVLAVAFESAVATAVNSILKQVQEKAGRT
jgi:hypothetical protein